MTFPADSARFTEILEATLRDLVRTGERLSNDNETKAFDLLEERFRATGAEVKRETVPLFVSTVPHAHLEVNGETLRAQGNAMTAPVTTGAGGSRRFRVTGKPVPWTDDIKAPEEPAVAVVTGLANLGILRRAERLGFAGVLFVTGERIHRMIVSDVWGSPVPGVEDRYVSIPNASIDNATAERLGDGPVTLEIETESRLYQKILKRDATDEETWRLSKVITVVLGIIAIGIGISKPGSIFQIVLFAFGGLGIWAAPILLGMYWRRATTTSVYVGVIAAEILYVLITLEFPSWSFGFNPLIVAWAFAMVVMILVSLVTKPVSDATIRRHFDDLDRHAD